MEMATAQTETQAPTIYRVPESNFDELRDSIKRLQRRAKKLGSEDIALAEVGTEDQLGYYVNRFDIDDRKVHFVAPGTNPDAKFGVGRWILSDRVRRFHLLTISGPAPVLNGYVFVGAIDVIRDEEGKLVGNMVRTLPEQTMPEMYRSAKPHCDHCGIDRRWKSTYVVMHEDGTYSQVGRLCLKDFTGHKSPESLAAMAEILMSAIALCGSAEDDDYDEDRPRGGRARERFNVQGILTRVATIVRTDGWKSKTAAQDTGGTSTAQMLATWLFEREPKQLEALEKHFVTSDGDKQLAKDTLEWLGTLSEKQNLSDYEYNLSLFALAGVVEEKQFGFIASAIPAYMRATEREIYAKKERLSSTFVGELKKRMDMVLTLTSLRYVEGGYGTQTMCKYLDEQGNVVVWWASDAIEMEIGTKIKAKATIKKHEEYNGVKQTTVSRLAVIETVALPDGSAPVKEIIFEGCKP
jgi:hypothetical protein